MIWHNGNLPGYSTYAGYLPALGASLVVLLNTDIKYQGREPGDYFADVIGSIVTPGHAPAGQDIPPPNP